MAIGAFPLAKLGALLLKQVSKPLANAVKNRAKTHPTFRAYVCMPPAQFYNWCEVQFKMYLFNLGKPVEVPKLNENQAIELGANILGEGIIFVIAAVIVVAEYRRQMNKESAKEAAKKEEEKRISNAIDEMFFENQKNSTEIKELSRHIHFLESELKKFPPPPPADLTPVKPKSLEESNQEGSPTNINYFHKQPTNTRQKVYHNVLRHYPHQTEDITEKKGSILSALSYLEDELLLGDRDHYIEQESNGVVMDSLDYLDTHVFKTSVDSNVILVLKNAPYASRFC
uniref:OPA3-like protein CG13603 n=1 Tax=Cacopsylla melanoneura TaxID=428564 RepID=A0A8D8LJI1_9HEMI